MSDSEKKPAWLDLVSNNVFNPDPGLYLVGTPIGNLRDISLRVLDVLSVSDVIYCEDKRVTSKLLNAYNIKRPLKNYTDHSDDQDRERIIESLQDDLVVSLVSDAGLPLISDPGYKLVRKCYEYGINVTSIPGPNAALTALQLSGIPSDSFSFKGFVPSKSGARKTIIEDAISSEAASIFYETANRLEKTLEIIHQTDPSRICVVARELTKKFEDIQSGKPAELINHYNNNVLKGEIVLIINGSDKKVSDEDAESLIRKYLQDNSLKDTVAIVKDLCNMPKKEIYDLAVKLKDG